MAAVEPTLNVNAWLDTTIVDVNVSPFAGAPSVDPLSRFMNADYLDMPKPLWLPASFDSFPTDQSIDVTSFATSSPHCEQFQIAHPYK